MHVVHPHIYVTAEKAGDLRSLAEVRTAIRCGLSRDLWQGIVAAADGDRGGDPLLPSSPVPGRGPESTAHANPDYTICKAVHDRILRGALACLITGDSDYQRPVLTQIEALYDARRWPDWRDQAHPTFPADLRTGMLGKAIGIAYDWLGPSLAAADRAAILEGLERRAFGPFWESVEGGAAWANGTNNWMACIVGGLGIAAMAVGDDYARADELIAFSLTRLRGYRSQYGPEGEFNESVGYSSANHLPVEYLMAHRYHTGGRENLAGASPFPEACRWYQYFTLPPGRLAALGDSHVTAPPTPSFVAAVAQATRDPVLQGYYLAHARATQRSMPCFELLWLDESLLPASPEGVLPRGRAFRAHSACISSRSDWDPRCTACVVVGKAGHGAEGHGHHDAGQVCIDGAGERLIVDLGNARPVYPADYFGPHRYAYHNAGVRGHNVLMFGGREMRRSAEDRAEILDAVFDDRRGGTWTLDVTGLYDGATRVRRTVVHLLPGVIAVLDEAALDAEEETSLRWHTVDRAAPDAVGRFTVRAETASLTGLTARLDGGPPTFSRGEHLYRPPYDRSRLGDLLHQNRDSYIEITCRARRCRLLSVFSVYGPNEDPSPWQAEGAGHVVLTADGPARVTAAADSLHVARAGLEWHVELGPL